MNMQFKEAQQLRRNWDGKPCKHPAFDREYDLGAHTGDFICTTCGEVFSPQEKERIECNRTVK